MKRVGIIGGIGPESTVEYYRFLIDEYRRMRPDGSYPSIIINSIDMKRMLDLVGAADPNDLVAYLVDETQRLAAAGAQIGAIASNTPHIVFDGIRARSPIPLISIVEAACKKAKELDLKKLALLGTRFTMQGNFYPSVFAPAGIALVTPAAQEQNYVHEKYMGELVEGIILEETRQAFLRIIEGMKSREGIDGVVLGGTELPLLLKEGKEDLPFLDTTRIHVESIIEEALRQS